MSRYSYKPYQNTDSLPREKMEELNHVIDEDWKTFNVKSHQFLTVGKFIILFNNDAEFAEQVSINIKSKSKKDLLEDIPEEIRREIEKLKIEYNLNQAQINELVKKTEQKKFKKLEIEKQLEQLETQAKIIDQRCRKKALDKFNNTYDKFFDVLNPALYDLDENQKKEVTTKLDIMQGAIHDIQDGFI